jgi:hypothetical protein
VSSAHDVALTRYLELVMSLRGAMPKPTERYTYSCAEDWLLTNCRFWEPSPLPPWVKPMRPQYCYLNAYILARRSKGRYRYVEGVAHSILPAVPHAWCVDDDDHVIDPTWREEIGRSYFGKVFDWRELAELHKATEHYSIIYDAERGFPLMQLPRPESEHGPVSEPPRASSLVIPR